MRKLLLTILAGFALLCMSSAFADTVWVGNMTSDQENPPLDTPGAGLCVLVLSEDQTQATIVMSIFNIESGTTVSHIHQAPPGVNGPVIRDLTGPDPENPVVVVWTSEDRQPLTKERVEALFNGELYCNAHSNDHPGGEIRGQLEPALSK